MAVLPPSSAKDEDSDHRYQRFGGGNGDEIWPKTQGIDVDGARSAVIIIDWTDFDGGELDVTLYLGQTGVAATDTLNAVVNDAGDILKWEIPPTAGAEAGAILIVNHFDGAPMCGYLHIKLADGGSLDVDATDVSVRVVY